jgi:hypothetical protein
MYLYIFGFFPDLLDEIHKNAYILNLICEELKLRSSEKSDSLAKSISGVDRG